MNPLNPSATSSKPIEEFEPLSGYTETNSTSTRLAPNASSSNSTLRAPSTRSAQSIRSSKSAGGTTGKRTTPRRSEAEFSGGSDERERERTRARFSPQPPKNPQIFATEEEWKLAQQEEKTGGWHHLPLILVALPPLGAIFHGRAENWSDGIVISIVCFYLYQLIKVPWELYYASHGRVVLEASLPKPGEIGFDAQRLAEQQDSVKTLRRTELISLATTMMVPAAGSYLLYYARELLSDPDRYINRFSISLFAIATSIKPFLHFVNLVKNNSLYHQERVWYPSTEVHLLKRRLEALETELSQLSRAFATKDDVRLLRDGVDVPLSQLSKAVRRFDRKEEFLRLSAEERFQILDAKLTQQAQEMARSQELLQKLQIQQEQSSLHQFVTALKYVLLNRYAPAGHEGENRSAGAVSWYERGALFWVFLPITMPKRAIEYISSNTGENFYPVEGLIKPNSNNFKQSSLLGGKGGQRLGAN